MLPIISCVLRYSCLLTFPQPLLLLPVVDGGDWEGDWEGVWEGDSEGVEEFEEEVAGIIGCNSDVEAA